MDLSTGTEYSATHHIWSSRVTPPLGTHGKQTGGLLSYSGVVVGDNGVPLIAGNHYELVTYVHVLVLVQSTSAAFPGGVAWASVSMVAPRVAPTGGTPVLSSVSVT